MDLRILDSDFKLIAVADVYNEFIWTDRYDQPGDFELVVAATSENFALFQRGRYIECDMSDRTMIIETIQTSTDDDGAIKVTISGRSLEAILERRVSWNEFDLATGGSSNLLWECIWTVLCKTCLRADQQRSSSDKPDGDDDTVKQARVIPELIFTHPTDERVTALTIESTKIGLGDSVLDAIQSICQDKHVGFKMTRNSDNEFVFELYLGVDHSMRQSENPYVVFSPEYENIINSEFIESDQTYKNVARVSGSSNVKTYIGTASGLERREGYISIDNSDGYSVKQLQTKAESEIKKVEYSVNTAFSGKIEAEHLFVYGEDFSIGDVVEVINDSGASSHSRITEFMVSDSDTGYECYPTFIDTATEDDTPTENEDE